MGHTKAVSHMIRLVRAGSSFKAADDSPTEKRLPTSSDQQNVERYDSGRFVISIRAWNATCSVRKKNGTTFLLPRDKTSVVGRPSGAAEEAEIVVKPSRHHNAIHRMSRLHSLVTDEVSLNINDHNDLVK